MAALHATQVFLGTITGTSVTTVYTVPSGYRFILKFVSVQEVSGSSCIVQLRSGSTGTIFSFVLTAYSTGTSAQVGNFWIVLNPGDTVQLARSNSGQVTATVSGSLHTI